MKINKNNFNMINEKKTKSTIYLLPGVLNSLGISLKRLERHNFINCYLADVNHDRKWEDCLFLLFQSPKPVAFGEFIGGLGDHVIDEYDYEGLTVLVVEFPMKFIANYVLFLEGKVSQFTQEYKDLFDRNPTQEEKNIGLKKSVAWCVFNKSSELRTYIEKQVGQKLDIDSELVTLNIEEEKLNMDAILLKVAIKETAAKIDTSNLPNNYIYRFSASPEEDKVFGIDNKNSLYICRDQDCMKLEYFGSNTIMQKYKEYSKGATV